MIELTKSQKKRRENIITAATELFADDGYYSVDMDRIKEKAGVAKATLYNYFNSKEGLYFECVENSYDLLFRKIFDYTTNSRSVKEFITLLIEAILEIHSNITSAVDLIGRVNHEMLLNVFQIIEKKRRQYFNKDFSRVTKLLSQNKLNPHIIFSTIWVSCSYLVYRLNVSPIASLEEIKTNMLNLFLNGLENTRQ